MEIKPQRDKYLEMYLRELWNDTRNTRLRLEFDELKNMRLSDELEYALLHSHVSEVHLLEVGTDHFCDIKDGIFTVEKAWCEFPENTQAFFITGDHKGRRTTSIILCSRDYFHIGG